MKKNIWMGVCTAIVGFAAVALAGQTQPPASGQSSRSTNDQRITVTGCLKPASAADTTPGTAGTTGTTATTGTTGTAGSATDTTSTQRFLLTDATMSPAAESSGGATSGTSTATSGTTAAEPGTSGATTYRLIANPAALAPHIGKKLELTGTVDNSSATAPTGTAAGAEPIAPLLRVESGKVLASSCPR